MTRVLEGPNSESESFLTRINFLHNFRTERLGQKAVQVIGDLCFGFFVFSVLILTAIAITYKPPDPWLQEQKSYITFFNSVGNSSFHPDDSVLITGDDDPNLSSPSTALLNFLPPAINTTTLDQSEPSLHCNTSIPWACSDLGLKLAVEKMNARHFPDLVFYSYRIVPARSHGDCDVAWRYRRVNTTSSRMYTDFRRVSLVRNSDCTFEVKKIGKWHSGVNASPKQLPISTVPGTATNSTPAFWENKYLVYTRGNEHCKSMGQWVWGFLCALGEAQYLNRTFVLDLDLCLSLDHSPFTVHPHKDFRFYFDLEHLANVTSIIEKNHFEDQLLQWTTPTERHVLHNNIEPANLKNDTHTVLYRYFQNRKRDDHRDDHNDYWSSVCEGQAETYIQRPWSFLWKSKLLMNIVDAICNKLEWDFDVVHVIRGYKAENKELWPNLDRDTSPESLIAKLKTMIGFRRKVYIASNEPYGHYFDRLREYFEVHMLDEYSHLWAENQSEWWDETVRVAAGRPVEFDGYMRMIVDTEMLYRGKKRVETFNDLTLDCKNGVGRC